MGTSSAAMPERAYMQLEPAACMPQYNCAREHTSSRQVSFNGRISEDMHYSGAFEVTRGAEKHRSVLGAWRKSVSGLRERF